MVSVTLTPGQLPIGYCFRNPQEYYETILALTSASVSLNVINVVKSETAPDGDPSIIWVRTVDGKLEGIYTFLSVWHREHPVPPSGQERVIWRGSINDLKTYDHGVDEAITEFTGPFWEVDTDFGDSTPGSEKVFRVPVGAGTNPTDYGGGKTTIAVGGTGGEEKHALIEDENALHTHDPLTVGANFLVQTTGGSNTVLTGGTGLFPEDATTASSGLGTAHQNMQPYLGVYFIKRTARKYITAS